MNDAFSNKLGPLIVRVKFPLTINANEAKFIKNLEKIATLRITRTCFRL
jgi:hypothetical protein